MYLCDVASVRQLCTFPLYLCAWVVCEDYLTCDIAFNAVMHLSRASTRGRYSRIEGVTDVMPTYMIIPRYSHNYAQFYQLLDSNSFTHRNTYALERSH